MLAGCTDTSTNYYFDATRGDNNNSGTSASEAWKSLDKLNGVVLKPGDKVLLRRGELFNGEFTFSAQGSSQKRIYIDAYGEGDKKPCIAGLDNSLYAARIYNSDYVTFQNIEIVNTGKQPLPSRSGLKIECSDYGVSRNIVINNVTVRDVNGSLVKEEGGGSGIYIANGGKERISVFDSLTIQNCHIIRCTRNAMIWEAYSNRQNWHPSKHTVIRSNLIEEVPGDGIVPIGCDSTLIEYNIMRNCPDLLPDTEAAAGIWPWSCDNTLVQFNEVSNHKAPWDAQGFDSDYNCTGTVIQYNYSHDNDGGFVLICNAGESKMPYSIGNLGTIVRYNISINDAIRQKKTRTGSMFSPSIHLAGPVKNTHISRNIIHVNKKPTANVDRTMITLDSWDGYPDSTYISENIFYTPETSRFNLTRSTNNIFDGNHYIGHFKNLPTDINSRVSLKIYQEQILKKDENGFKGLFQLMDTISVTGTKGVFVNKKKIEEFFDRTIKN